MSLVLKLESEEKIEDDVLKTPLFTLYDSKIVIKNNKEKIVFDLNEISNVRYSKKRNFLINFVLLFCILAIYCFVSDYLNTIFPNNILLLAIALISSIFSLSIKNHTYILFINMNHFCYRKLRLSKKDEPYVKYFISIFKKEN
jgi:hypothetical protein